MDPIVFETPKELVCHLYLGEDTDTGICRRPSSLFNWYTQAKRFYDPMGCPACDNEEKLNKVIDGYRNILNFTPQEKNKSVSIVGGSFMIKLDGVVLGFVE